MPEDTPPVETPPAETPPVETPPAADLTPPAETPPVETPPADVTPPVETPPAETPPAEPDAAPPTDDTPPDEPVDRVVPAVADYVLPEGVPVEMAQFAHDNDMTQLQFDATLTQFGQIMTGVEQERLTIMRAEGEKTIESWGNQKEYNLNLAKRALTQNDPEDKLKEVLDISGYGNHPAVLNFFLKIGQSMKEGGFLKGAVNTPGQKGQTAANAMFGKNHPSSN